MDGPILMKCSLFSGIPPEDLAKILEKVPYHIQTFEKGETVFHLMEEASRIGLVLEGRVQAQKPFPNGSQVNVSVRGPGKVIGAAASFSAARRYPCDVVALEPARVLMIRRQDMLVLLQKDIRIMERFMAELATSAFMLQQRLELLSYSGIAQKAAFYLLIHARQSGRTRIEIPGSVSSWAMVMNVSRPSLHRELKKLEEKKIISYAPPFIDILDPGALQDVLSSHPGSASSS